MSHNDRDIDAGELFELLTSISKYVEQELHLYALGGTALTILKIKPSTLDVDINIDNEKEYDYLCKIFGEIGFERKAPYRWFTQEGLAFDLFHGSNILGTQLLHDCLTKSRFVQSFGKIKLYTLSPYDIIISKLARGETRDFNDIQDTLKHEKLNVIELIKRYKETMETSIVSEYKQKLLDLIEIKFKEWKFQIDEKLIGEVKKWN
ncbi:MAG: DUF6036 family nucleotidyltransferase [Nanoarchaeota archaeon]